MKDLITIASEGEQISGFLMERLKLDYNPIRLSWADEIKMFSKCVSLINELGEIEHSSDWDLGLKLIIEGVPYQTIQGYSEFEVKDENLIIEAPEIEEIGDIENDMMAFYKGGNWIIPISKLTHISLFD